MNENDQKIYDVIYDKLCAADNQDVPLEEYPNIIVEVLARNGYAVVPTSLPYEVLGEAALTGVFEVGNPKFGWDYLVAKTRGYLIK